jgi:hypothetical protein
VTLDLIPQAPVHTAMWADADYGGLSHNIGTWTLGGFPAAPRLVLFKRKASV